MIKLNTMKFMASAMYLLSSDAEKYIKTFAQYYGKTTQERLKYMTDPTIMSGKKYRSHIINLEYMPKLYLRPVEVTNGRPKMVPSGDCIKAALLNVAVIGLAQKLFPNRDFDCMAYYPEVSGAAKDIASSLQLMAPDKLNTFLQDLETQIAAMEKQPIAAKKQTVNAASMSKPPIPF